MRPRVALIGSAAHATPAGLSLGLMDAKALAAAVSRAGGTRLCLRPHQRVHAGKPWPTGMPALHLSLLRCIAQTRSMPCPRCAVEQGHDIGSAALLEERYGRPRRRSNEVALAASESLSRLLQPQARNCCRPGCSSAPSIGVQENHGIMLRAALAQSTYAISYLLKPGSLCVHSVKARLPPLLASHRAHATTALPAGRPPVLAGRPGTGPGKLPASCQADTAAAGHAWHLNRLWHAGGGCWRTLGSCIAALFADGSGLQGSTLQLCMPPNRLRLTNGLACATEHMQATC